MKKVLTVIALAVASSAAFSQNMAIDKFVDKYEGEKGFTTITVAEKLFDLAASATPDNESAELKQMIDDLKGIKILTYENEEGLLKSREYYNEIESLIPKSDYEELLNVNSDGEKVVLYGKMSTDKVMDEMLLLVNDDGEFVMVDILGKIDFDKISKLSDMHINGINLDELKKVEDTKSEK